MIHLKMSLCSAIRACRFLPFSSLKGTELNSMSSKFWRFVEKVIFSSRKASQHLISIVFPHFLGSNGNSFDCFFCMAVAFCISIADTLSFSRLRDKTFALFRMLSIPPRRSFSDEVFALTFKRACFPAILTCNLLWASAEFSLADDTFKVHYFASHGLRENWVNSGDHLETSYCRVVSKSILSQALAETLLKVQRLEGEPYGGNNSSTKAQPERDDIVRAAWRHAEADHKQFCDNKTTTPQDGLTRDQWQWAQYAATVTIDGFTERVANAGDSKIEDILEAKKMQAEESLMLLLEQHMFQATPGSKDIQSLATIIASSGQVGGINGTTNTWWQSQVTTSGSFAAQGRADLTNLWNLVSVQNPIGGPEMIVSDQNSFQYYESSLVAQERFTDNKLVDIGIQNLQFKTTPWTWSPQATSGVIYLVHSKGLEFIVNSDTDFYVTPFVQPTNQDARTSKILLACCFASGNRRKLAKMTSVSA